MTQLPPSSLSVPPDRRKTLDGFAPRLRALMEERGETQLGLAGKTGIGQTTLSGYMAGRNLPVADVLVTLCRHFDVSSDWLLGLSAERKKLHDRAVGFVDDDVLQRFLTGDRTLPRSARIAVEFPPAARLVDRAEFDRILRETGADATPGRKRLPWRRGGR